MTTAPLDPPSDLNRAGLPLRLWLLPFLLGLLAFAGTWDAGFVYDDIDLLEKNASFRSWSTVVEGFEQPFWELAAYQQNFTPYYRPVAAAAFVALTKLGGGEPWAFHLASTLVHACCALLVSLLAVAIGLRRGPALAAGVVFALSGAHVEAVAWASALPDLLATLFSLLALLAWTRGRLLLGLAAVLLAMLAKEAAYATWLVLLGISVLGSPKLPLPRRALALPLLLLVAGAVYWLRAQAFESPWAGFNLRLTETHFTRAHKLTLALGLIARYLGFLLLPLESRPFRGLRVDQDWTDPGIVWVGALGLLLTLAALALWLTRGRRTPLLLIGLALLFGGLAPVLNVNSIGRFPFEERFTYLPSAGFALLLAGLAARLLRRPTPPRNRALLAVAALSWLAVNLVPILRVTPEWSDNERFARWATEVSPETMTPWLLAGQATLSRAMSLPQGSSERVAVAEEAYSFFERSLQVDADEYLVSGPEREDGNVGLGNALYTMGDYRVAEQVYEKTLEGYRYAQLAHLGLANIALYKAEVAYQRMLSTQDPAEAEVQRQEALRLALRARGHAEQATRGYRELSAAHFDLSVAHYWLAQLGDDAESMAAAEAAARQAVALEPNNEQFVLQLVEVLYFRNRPNEIVQVLEAFLRRVPDTPSRQEFQATIDQLRGGG